MASKIQNAKFKIVVLTQYYPPEHGAPQNRLHDLARRWVLKGHEVTVLTAMPNYPVGIIFPDYQGKFTFNETIDGVKVIRCWILPSKKKSTVRQLICYFSFVKSAAFFGFFKLGKSDFLICESPPLFLGCTALFLKFVKGTRLVMNISDLWPESAVQLGMIGKGPALSFLEWFEKLLYKKSVLVSCQTEGIVKGVKKRYPEAKTFLFPNGVDLEMFNKQPKDAKFAESHGIPRNSFVVGYAGNHGRSQALSQVIEAANILKNEKIFFMFFGDGPEKSGLQNKTSELGLKNLKFLDSVPREKMSHLLSQFDIALVPLKDIKIFEGARPSKIFELMAEQIPFIFCGKGEGAEIALKSGCAKVVPPENPEKLAEGIIEFTKMDPETRRGMGLKGRSFVVNSYDRAKLAEEFMNELGKLPQ
ncbi:MAG: glycosyltransferase family 4 protein [Victivallales bacterium]